MKAISLRFILLITILTTGLNDSFSFSLDEEANASTELNINSSDSSVSGEKATDEHDYGPLVFIVVALIIGASTRHILSKIDLPYTVALLLIGLLLGIFGRFAVFDTWNLVGFEIDASIMDRAINWAAHIDPHLIMFIFLPVLIFEATYAIDIHLFKKSFANSVMLAVPGIIMSIIITTGLVWALIVYDVGLKNWTLEITILLGTVVSATDPVAVVSILKELGASKKLSTLIESESLLNDGVAIVIFMVVFLGITGQGIEHSAVLEFIRVAFGGIAIGVIIGRIALFWLKKVSSDVLIEITIIVASAYLVFFVCEYGFHVSGVLGTVTLGILMAGPGRTRISPSVQKFIHEFWEFLAFAANTMIFLIVGIVIAERIIFTPSDLLILIVLYVIIHVSRLISQTFLFPVMKRSGYGMNMNDAKILWWGALRGAIGLALALMVEVNENIDKVIREEFLFLTAGIVIMTLTINATTMKKLAFVLGMTKVSKAKEYILNRATTYLGQQSRHTSEQMKDSKHFKKVDWSQIDNLIDDVDDNHDVNHISDFVEETRLRILEKEKSNYWTQFKAGLLNTEAYDLLVAEIDEIIDSNGERSLSDREDLEQLLDTKNKLIAWRKIKLLGSLIEKLNTNKLFMCFDAAKGFLTAQEECFVLLNSILVGANEAEAKLLHVIEMELKENKIQALTFLRKFRNEFPELYVEITTKQASLTILNNEVQTLKQLFKNGQLSHDETSKMISDVEVKIRKLKFKSY